MPIVSTDMRCTTESARRIRYEPSGSITATDVQTAIEQVAVIAVAGAPGVVPTIVTAAMSPYAPTLADTLLLVDTTGGVVNIQLPLSATRVSSGRYIPLTVKDDKENAGVNAINVLRAGAELIDGLTSYPLDSPSISAIFQPIAAGGYDVI
jgi:hypothetical protein